MKHTACAILMCLICSGCSLLVNAGRNFVVQPIQCLDDCRTRKLNKRLAAEAWEKLTAGHEGGQNKHYGRGFRKGFADYLYSGGSGQPPPVPPWYYQTLFYQTPAGYQAILDWYAGFRHGSAAALESSDRNWIVLPLSAPLRVGPRGIELATSTTQLQTDLPMPQPLMPPAEPSGASYSGSIHNRMFTGGDQP